MSLKSYKLKTYIISTDQLVNNTSSITIISLIIIGHMNINFTDTTIQAAFIGFVGALIAAFGASYLTVLQTNSKDKKKHSEQLRIVHQSLILNIQDFYLPKLYAIVKQEDEFIETLKKKSKSHKIPYTSFLNIDIFSIAENIYLTEIFLEKRISTAIIYDIKYKIDYLKNRNPRSILLSYNKTLNQLIKKKEKEVSFIYSIPGKTQIFQNRKITEINDRYDKVFINIEEVYITKLKNSTKQISHTINSLEDLIKKLK